LDDWRLPSGINNNGSGPDWDFYVTESELGHIYYIELENDRTPPDDPGGTTLENTGSFINLEDGLYWYGDEYIVSQEEVWGATFCFGYGCQSAFPKDFDRATVWAVRDGDVGAASVPEPAMGLLFLSLFLGIVGIKRDRQRHR
jgi:hypothetical protein